MYRYGRRDGEREHRIRTVSRPDCRCCGARGRQTGQALQAADVSAVMDVVEQGSAARWTLAGLATLDTRVGQRWSSGGNARCGDSGLSENDAVPVLVASSRRGCSGDDERGGGQTVWRGLQGRACDAASMPERVASRQLGAVGRPVSGGAADVDGGRRPQAADGAPSGDVCGAGYRHARLWW
jgi:hypothetical protein